MWRHVKGLEDRYLINKDGLIKSLVNGGYRRGYIMPIGYRAVTIDGKMRYVHRLLAEAFIPNPDGKPNINHKDGIKANNSLDNLEWCTHSENMKHAYRIGLNKSPIGPGMNGPAAKLTDEKVLDIRRRIAEGAKQQDLADEYGVAKGTIGFIARRETWAHI